MAEQKVQFTVSAQDDASAVLRKVADQLDKTGDTASKAGDKVQSGFGDKVSAAMKNAEGASKSFAIGLTAAIGAIGLLGGMALKQAADFEQTQVSFEVLTGSVENGKALIQDLTSFAAKTPFTFTGITDAAKQLMAYGVAQKDIIPTASMLGDIAMGNQEKFQMLSYAFGQISTNGKLMGQDLMQLTNQGFNPLEYISKRTGKSISDLREDMSKGLITFDMVNQAFKDATGEGGRYFQMMSKQSQTFSGLMSNLGDARENFLRTAGKPILDALKAPLQDLIQFVQTGLPIVIENFGKFFNRMKENQAVIWIIAGAVMGALVPALYASATALRANIVALAPFIAAGAAIAGVAYLIYQAYQTNFLGLKDIVKGVVDFFVSIPAIRQAVVTGVKTWLDNAEKWFSTARENIKNGVQSFFDGIVAGRNRFKDTLIAIIGGMIGFRVGMFTAFYQLLTGDRQAARDTVKQTFENVRNLMMTFIQPILTRFQTAISAARTAVSTSFTNTRNAISTFFSNTWTKIQNAAKNAVEWIRDFFNGGGKEMLTSAFNNMLDGFVNIAKSILNTVIGFFEGMINRAIDGINKLIRAANKVSPLQIGYVDAVSIGRLAHGGIAGQGANGGSAMSFMSALSGMAQNFATGGMVRGPQGIDVVPAMLTAGEVVLNAAQQGNLANVIGSREKGGDTYLIIQNPSFYGDDKAFAEKVGDQILETLKYHVSFSN